ncbi:hypothetical protein ABW636_07735 [Aquimarina sp. 2201CG1-2-11]|uniref:hypothetical protein n=1 Tax=Aquimarina discodermiae TaxID=3231043 RepID=UPI003461D24C
MKKLLLLILLCTIVEINAQSLSKTHIIYERKDQVVLNDGKQYQIVLNQPFYEVSDNTIAPYKESNGHVLRLNRVLRLKDKDGIYIELIEWVKEEHIKLYLLRGIGNEQ